METPASKPLAGFFSTQNSKTVSISEDQPEEGWVTLSFGDESDPLAINDQMFYVPKDLFDAAINAYSRHTPRRANHKAKD